MNRTFKSYLDEFDSKFSTLEFIDSKFHQNELGVLSFAKKSKTRDINNNYSEEYIRTRFLYAMVYSGFYPKELICVEYEIPKGNNGKSLNPDIVLFKNSSWKDKYYNKKFNELRFEYLAFFETKKKNQKVYDAIERQLRPAMAENESPERVFGIYFDNENEILIFKKISNSPIRRFNEELELSTSGLLDLNLTKRDLLVDLPTYNDLISNNESISDVSKLTIDSLDAIDEEDFKTLLSEFKRIFDREKPKHSQRDLIVEFLTLKVFDEKRSKRNKEYLSFYIDKTEKLKDGTASIQFRDRIKKLYSDAKKEYSHILSNPYFSYDAKSRPSNTNEERFLVSFVELLQKRAILKSKNEKFNQIIFNNFGDEKRKAENNEFFTPIPIVKTMVKMINPIKGEDVCDPCCGICDFLAMAFKYAHRNDENYPPSANNYYGFDIEENNLKLAALNLVLNGDGGAILKNMNSISEKLLIDDSVSKTGDFTIEHYEINDWSHKTDGDKDLKKFDVILTNPPFGKGRDLKTGKNGKWDVSKNVIELYETYGNKNGDGTTPNSIDMGVIFLENAYKSLKDGGRMAIVISNSIASIAEWQNVREWFINKMRIVALFDLPANTFGETGVSTTVIIAYKPKDTEQNLLSENYEIYIKEIENTGYEVKTIGRTIDFIPKFIIDENTFETTEFLDEDFSIMINEFNEYMKRQSKEIKEAFHF